MNNAHCKTTCPSAAYLTFGYELRTINDVSNDFREVVQSDNFIPHITRHLQKLSVAWYEAKGINEKKQDYQKMYAGKKRRDGEDFKVGDRI